MRPPASERRTMKTAIPIVALAWAAAAPAFAQDATQPLSAMIAALEADGYRVTDVDVDRDGIEVEASTGDGRPVELRLDPRTGEVLSETPDT